MSAHVCWFLARCIVRLVKATILKTSVGKAFAIDIVIKTCDVSFQRIRAGGKLYSRGGSGGSRKAALERHFARVMIGTLQAP